MTTPERNLSDWLADIDGDGYIDTANVSFVIEPPAGVADRAFVAALLDLGARIGLESRVVADDLFVADRAGPRCPDEQVVTLRGAGDVLPLLTGVEGEDWDAAPLDAQPSRCLTRLFTLDGALEDRDGDLLPDASRIAFDLPEELPAQVAAALAQFAARIGQETGGITFPLVRAGDARFSVRLSDGPAALRSVAEGWRIEGGADAVRDLLRWTAGNWPHEGSSETPGIGGSLAWLRRALAGNGPEPGAPGRLLWELQWSARWEVNDILDTFRARVLPALDRTAPARFTIFASEPPEQRHRLAATLRAELAAAGHVGTRVTVLRAFKAGLSWLQDVVTPALEGRDAARVRIAYRRYEHAGPHDALDLPLRWLQELFPGPEMMASALGIPLEAIEVVEGAGDGPIWACEAWDAAGISLGRWQCSPLWHTWPFVHAWPDAGAVCVTTGGIVVEQGGTRQEYPVETDLERFWRFWQLEVLPRLLAHIDAGGGPKAALQPFFGALEAEVWISEPNQRLGIREENDSAAEALHEEIYFGTLDALELYGKRNGDERTNAPGAVVPVVHVVPGVTPHARVCLRAAPARLELPRAEARVESLALDYRRRPLLGISVEVEGDAEATAARLRALASHQASGAGSITASVRLGGAEVPLALPRFGAIEPAAEAPTFPPPMDENIHGEGVMRWAEQLAALPNIAAWVEDASYEGRPIVALRLTADTGLRVSATKEAILKPTYLIIARHHANEISSTNAALRLAWLCATTPAWQRYLDRVNVLIIPEENPDGAALHARLAAPADARDWKHHPARYNALGFEYGFDHFNPDSRFGESRARTSIWRRWPADVVVDNHGVPSHEWVQPFAGFGSPPRFRVSYWVVQALLYGIAHIIDDEQFPRGEHERAVLSLRDAVSAAVRDTDIGAWNETYGSSYRFWGQSREPEHFPGEFHDGMLWHIQRGPSNPDGRGYEIRFPRTTVISWVTEVNDETASGGHLERVARAHLLANQATLDLLYAAAPPIRRWRRDDGNGRVTLRVGRERPLMVNSHDSEQ